MFIENKYTRWYYNIVTRAQTREIDSYTEKHHIIPRCLGGSNKKDNIAKLTPREHFVCHRLLTKMTQGAVHYKMIYAAWRMCNQKNRNEMTVDYHINSRLYNTLREKVATMMSQRVWTDEMRQRAREKALAHLKKNEGSSKAKSTKPKQYLTCPHCNKTCDSSNAKRWHFNNCQTLPGAIPVKIPALSESNLKRWARVRAQKEAHRSELPGCRDTTPGLVG